VALLETANKIDLVGQTASIPTQTLFNTGPIGQGIYVAFIDVITTTAGSAGTVTVGITWNNGFTSAGFDSATFNLNAVGEQAALLGNFFSTFSSPITFNTTVVGAVGNPVYTLRIRLLYLG